MTRLQGRVAIVTGAGQGVGHGVARALAAEGASVVVANRSRDKGEAVAAEIERDFAGVGASAFYIETDVASEQSARDMVGEAVSHFGRLDVLVNNATPGGGGARIEKIANADVELHLDVNFRGVLWAMQAAFPHMKQAGQGRIITMCSLNGVNAHQYTVAYNSSKEAARTLTRTAAVEWGRYGITCNVVCPFATSPSWELFMRFDPEGAGRIVEGNPIQRVGDPEADVGPVVVFLASDESGFVTGNTIHVDGGGHINGVAWKLELPE